MMHRNATNASRPRSLVDTLGTGFRALNRALPALLAPLALDLWYWLGPHISLRPLVDRIRAAFDPATWRLLQSRVDPALISDRPFDLKLGARIEALLPFWSHVYTLEPAGAAPQPITPATWYVGGFLTLLGAVVAINLALTFLTIVFLMPLADSVRDGAPSRSWIRRVGRAWLAQLAVIGIVLALLMVIGFPLLTIAGVLTNISPGLGNFVAIFAMAVLLWIIFTSSFAYDAIVLSGAGPIGAMLASLLVIRKSFWSAVRLYLLNFFILAGLNVVWQGLMTSVPGMVVAMITSAYVGAGLVAAHLVFYRDRLPASAARDIASHA
jgi:hypothetical protein